MALGNHYAVAVVGAGPTGLILAHLLARQGVRVVLIERGASVVNEARAVTIDDESLRTLQATGTLDRILPDIVQGYGVHYYSWRQSLFARIEPHSTEYGYPKRNAFRQPLLVQELAAALAGQALVELCFGHELTDFAVEAERVQLGIRTAEGERRLSADWLVACDGGRSMIRERLGIGMEGSTYGERWLIADLIGRRDDFRHTRTFCDPVRPAIRLPGPQKTVRYEFMLRPDERPEQVLDETAVRDWIRLREPADADIDISRKVVYTFHARVATRWRQGRVLLAGDAAHLSPPFAGQGMNSGVRDAMNLAWKLGAVTRRVATPELLDTYEAERKPHAWALIRMALRIGAFMQPRSRLGAALTQGALRLACLLPAARDYILQLRFKPKPRLSAGLFAPWKRGAPVIPSGQLMTQPLVQPRGGSECLLDEVLGSGFALIRRARVAGPASAARAAKPAQQTPVAARGLEQMGVPFVVLDLVPGGSAFPPDEAGTSLIRDVSGELFRVLDSAGADAVLLRPDRYVLAYLGGDSEEDFEAARRALSAFYTGALVPQ